MKRLLIIPINLLLAMSTTGCMEQQLTPVVEKQEQWHNIDTVLKIENTIMRDLKNQHTTPKKLCKLASLHQTLSYVEYTQKTLLEIKRYIPKCQTLKEQLRYNDGYIDGVALPLAGNHIKKKKPIRSFKILSNKRPLIKR